MIIRNAVLCFFVLVQFLPITVHSLEQRSEATRTKVNNILSGGGSTSSSTTGSGGNSLPPDIRAVRDSTKNRTHEVLEGKSSNSNHASGQTKPYSKAVSQTIEEVKNKTNEALSEPYRSYDTRAYSESHGRSLRSRTK